MFQQLVHSNLNQTIPQTGLSGMFNGNGQWQAAYLNGIIPSGETATQIICSMKLLRKQSKTVARTSNVLGQSLPQADPSQTFNDAAPRAPLSADAFPADLTTPDDLAFRNYLKNHLPRFKASDSLQNKIRHTIFAED